MAVRAEKRVFTDAEWERALKQASQLKRTLYGNGEGADDESDGAQAIADSAELVEPPAGAIFSASEWDRAFRKAPAALAAMKSDEATESYGDNAAARASAANNGAAESDSEESERGTKVFSEAEWDGAFREAGPELEVRPVLRRTISIPQARPALQGGPFTPYTAYAGRPKHQYMLSC
jgi:hypothetical protein